MAITFYQYEQPARPTCCICNRAADLIDEVRGPRCADHIMPFLKPCQCCGRDATIVIEDATYCARCCPEAVSVAVEG